ncbi:MAG TPA: TlpA disulfide reductase family protein [Gemmatimonadaceae bacterium]|nr:TlpA disulfide reductase family protein [Gemmatimonadaceae bacterium]
MIATAITRVAAVVMLLAIPACGDAAPQVKIGQSAPKYRGVAITGDSTSLDSLHGQVVLLNIWATWCEPCKEELPVLEKMYTARAPQGFQIIGVSVDAQGEERKIKDFANSYGITYPIWLDPTERVTATFLAVGVPASYLIARDGTLLWRKVGPIRENEPELGRLLDSALAVPRGS